MAALSPGYLRIGGTMADRLIFNSHKQPRFKISTFVNPDGGRCAHEEDDCNPFIRPNFTMSGKASAFLVPKYWILHAL